MADAVALDAIADKAGGPGDGKKWGFPKVKILVALFIIFILVQSELFVNNVVGSFRGGVSGRTPTTYGVAVQGVFLVLFYILAVYLIDHGAL